jgi:hypothetical protein
LGRSQPRLANTTSSPTYDFVSPLQAAESAAYYIYSSCLALDLQREAPTAKALFVVSTISPPTWPQRIGAASSACRTRAISTIRRRVRPHVDGQLVPATDAPPPGRSPLTGRAYYSPMTYVILWESCLWDNISLPPSYHRHQFAAASGFCESGSKRGRVPRATCASRQYWDGWAIVMISELPPRPRTRSAFKVSKAPTLAHSTSATT